MTISQREARRLQKRVAELEQLDRSQANAWTREYPGGTNIATASFAADGVVVTAIKTARMLKHAVIATSDGDGRVYFYALPLPRT